MSNTMETVKTWINRRHNRIYTKVVIHQMNRNVNRECDVCETEPETLMHIFFECKKPEAFHAAKVLVKKGTGKDVTGEEWRKLFLFGINMNKNYSKLNLWNMVLSKRICSMGKEEHGIL